ncbi:MAG: helix-turn-helix domain-containing protein [Proteobacteria bacterium]|nr:helix-turn-helix domain-containing protein [Pseudomonadota bacterium]
MNQTNFKIRTDREIGARIRSQREDKGMTQDQLGATLEHRVSGKEIDSYEKADAPISAARLMEIAVALETPIAYFFIAGQGRTGRTDNIPFSTLREDKFICAIRGLNMDQQKAVMGFLQNWPATGFCG